MPLATAQSPFVVAQTSANERTAFVRLAYLHVAGAWLGFFVLECTLLQLPVTSRLGDWIRTVPFGWLALLGGCMALAWLARVLVGHSVSRVAQYAALTLFVGVLALLFSPLVAVAQSLFGPNVLLHAIVLSGALFLGLLGVVFNARADISFPSIVLVVGGLIAMGLITSPVFFGLNRGFWLAAGMISLAGAGIVYDTTRSLLDRKGDEYVAAGLELFASIVLVLWYAIKLLLHQGRKE